MKREVKQNEVNVNQKVASDECTRINPVSPPYYEDSEVRFRLGRVVVTRGVIESLEPELVMFALARHASGDWGELCDFDKTQNELAVEHGDRILSKYKNQDDEMFYIITEWDRSTTTVLLTHEY
jgi:hypothetical protein